MSRVVVRNIFAFILVVGLAFRVHSVGYCNGGWEEFFVYLAYFVFGVAIVEFLNRFVWHFREGRKWLERPAELEDDAPLFRGGELIAPHGLVVGFLFALAVLSGPLVT